MLPELFLFLPSAMGTSLPFQCPHKVVPPISLLPQCLFGTEDYEIYFHVLSVPFTAP